MTKLPKSNKGWKKLFIRVIDSTGFEVDLKWRVIRAGGNQAFGMTSAK